jgi:1-acyl-sn-glycerol-3-phosphate acyltransferase
MIYWAIRHISKAVLKLFYNFKIYGGENIPKNGPYIVCANHCSFLDPLVICDSIPRRVYWVVLKDLYDIWPLSILLRATSCIPVNGAINEALKALKQNKVIGIFPEGRRTYTGQLMRKGKKGPAILVMKAGVPILPGWINGTFEAYPRRAKFIKIHPIQIYFEKPLKFDKYEEDEIIDEKILMDTTQRILDSIAAARKKLEGKNIYTS